MSEIHIEPIDEELLPGEVTRVPFRIVLDAPTKARGLHATFHGAEEAKAQYTTYNAATKSTQTHTAVALEHIVKEETVLSGREKLGFLGNIKDAFATLVGGGEHEVLPQGEHRGEIEVTVPVGAPASFAGENCRVFYTLSVVLDIPLGRDLSALQSFRVRADGATDPGPEASVPVRTRYPEDQERGLLDSWLAPDVRVEVNLEGNVFRSGQTIEGSLEIETGKPLEYRAIQAHLIAVESTAAEGHTGTYTHTGDPVPLAKQGSISQVLSKPFRLPAICPGPATVQGTSFSVDCYLEIQLDVPWAKDPKIRVPVILLE